MSLWFLRLLQHSCLPCSCTRLDVVEVLVGKGTVDVLVPFVGIDDNVNGMGLRPVGIERIVLVSVVEDAFTFVHKGFDEGIGHRVGLRLVGVVDSTIQTLDGCRLSKSRRAKLKIEN